MALKYSLLFLFLILIVTVHLSSGRRKKKQRCPKILRDNLVVRIRSAGWIAKLKCRRHFTMVEGDPNLTCVRNVWRGRIPKCITSGCEILPQIANGEKMYLYDNAMTRFSCSPGYSLEGSPALSCDGINWNDTMPVCVGQQTDMLACDFEDAALCGWTGDPKADFQWVRSQGVAYQVGTAPKRDHTLDRPEGHFMYIDSSVRREEGQNARFYSPVFSGNITSDGAACFSFYYHMYGHTTGSMNVYIKPEGQSLEHQGPVFQVNGFNNNQWFHEVFSINALSENFQVVMEVVHSSGAMADVAVDDVRLARGDECIQLRQEVETNDDTETTTTTTTTTSPTTTTTTSPTTSPTTTTTASTTTTSTPPTTARTTSTSTPSTTTTTALSTTAATTTTQTEPPAAATVTGKEEASTDGSPVTTPSTTPTSTSHTEATVTPTGSPPDTAGTPTATEPSSPATENATTPTDEGPLPTTTPPAIVSESTPATSGTTTAKTTTAASVPPSQPSSTPAVVTTPEGTENKTLPVTESEAKTSPSGSEAPSVTESSTEGIQSTVTPVQPVTKPPTTTTMTTMTTTTASTEEPSWPSATTPSPTPPPAPSPTTASLPSVAAGAKDSSTSTATISLVVFVVVAVVVAVAVGVGVYVWRIRRQEKLPEDSEIRFLARDEVQMDGNIFSLGSTRPPRSTVA
nr:zonadhesin-like [Penaeus vannamei]